MYKQRPCIVCCRKCPKKFDQNGGHDKNNKWRAGNQVKTYCMKCNVTLCCDKVGKRFSNYNLSCFTIFHQFNEYSKMNFCDNLEELIDVNYYTKKEKVLTSGVENNLLNEPVYKKRKKICPSTVTTRSQTRSTNIF